jgi:hypothetical protein
MNATLYTGNNSTQTITNGVAGQSFQPDFLWLKKRSGSTASHTLFNSVTTLGSNLKTDSTGIETLPSPNDGLTAINSNGFSLGANNNSGCPDINYSSGSTYVAWQWKAGGAAVSNTAGTISSQVSANTTSGFSVVTYTGNGTAGATWGHGLGVAPSFVIVKGRTNVDNWMTWHTSYGGGQYFIELNTTNALGSAANVWNNTVPNSSVVTVGTGGTVNTNTTTYVAYCWSQIAGYSAFGSYTGNASTDGPFVYTGFRPRFLMIKRTDAANHWLMYDTSRDTYNVGEKWLRANATDAEATGLYWDGLSNGFKIRVNDTASNASGGTYIYAAFAENPFKYANAR